MRDLRWTKVVPIILLAGYFVIVRVYKLYSRDYTFVTRRKNSVLSSSSLILRRLYARGTHESTEEEETIIVPVVRNTTRKVFSDPYLRHVTTKRDLSNSSSDIRRKGTEELDNEGNPIAKATKPISTKAQSDPMEYAKKRDGSEFKIKGEKSNVEDERNSSASIRDVSKGLFGSRSASINQKNVSRNLSIQEGELNLRISREHSRAQSSLGRESSNQNTPNNVLVAKDVRVASGPVPGADAFMAPTPVLESSPSSGVDSASLSRKSSGNI